ncbi:hypothetical protein FJZ17_00565 [Candidatus Pacearchaeota archaeon]|nr:hypothetical protein [Candidatus Pacearchaeota archaeon]
MISKEKLKYMTRYTAASYLDFFMSLPIEGAQAIAKLSQKALGERTPKLLTLEDIEKNSPTLKARNNLREKLDTRGGSVFIKNNIIGAVPFLLAGLPAAEGAGRLIEHYLPNAPEIVKYALNSAGTLAAQMATGYATFMALEIHANRHKYENESGRLSPKKIAQGIKRAVKAFLSFDIPYIAAKLAGQSALLALGKSPAIASLIFDGAAFPTWYTLGIPIGLEKGVIEARDYPETNKNQAVE